MSTIAVLIVGAVIGGLITEWYRATFPPKTGTLRFYKHYKVEGQFRFEGHAARFDEPSKTGVLLMHFGTDEYGKYFSRVELWPQSLFEKEFEQRQVPMPGEKWN
jgi:hypothetical protein